MDISANSVRTSRPPRLSGFDPVRCLGQGSQGQVWLMAPQDGSKHVAAKFLVPAPGSLAVSQRVDPHRHNESQVTREWGLLAQFRHEHLIPVAGLVTDQDGSLVLIMEYAAGGSLTQIVHARGVLSVGEAVTILTPMGQVLDFLHERGAVHGDISSGNVLLSASGKPYLADFGVSRVLGDTVETPSGTAGFYCPSDTRRDTASDVYALAAVGWFVLTGYTPPLTRGRAPLSSLVRDVPRELVAALEAGLQEDPRQRPTAAALAQAVFRSARAEALILAHAVHPSVLPELPTRHSVLVKPKRRRKVRSHGRSWFMGGIRNGGAEVAPLKKASWFRRHRKIKGLALLWGSGERVPRPGKNPVARLELGADGQRHRRAVHRRQGRRRDGRARQGRRDRVGTRASKLRLWLIALLVMGVLLFGVAVSVGGRLQGDLGTPGTNQTPRDQDAPAAEAVEKAPVWARALPPQIRLGLMSTAAADALPALAWVRSYALSNTDETLLSHINAANSPALAADVAIVEALEAEGHGFTGLEFTVEKVHHTPAGGSVTGGDVAKDAIATVQATIITSAFAEQDSTGALVHNYPKERRQELRFVLTRADSRWTIQEILNAAPTPQ
ncbi:serine/threonine-protein kinase [Arthrobacter psychrochitiniphilus]|uniref:serine/threonine-protein kinase n=1 Tax=Arthrobacter psychrochitiniphilus TaxID=291045 RepID=UPI003F7B7E11